MFISGTVVWCEDAESTLLYFRPVYGLIFLFKWRSGEEADGSIVRDDRLEEIFFAKQVKIIRELSFLNSSFYNCSHFLFSLFSSVELSCCIL